MSALFFFEHELNELNEFMEKRIDRFQYDGENFHVVIEEGKLTFTDKETGKVIERK